MLTLIHLQRRRAARRRAAVARPEAVARDRHAADAGAEAAAARRAGGRHDRRRDRAHRRAVPVARRQAFAGRRRARHELRRRSSPKGARRSPCCTKAACSPKGCWPTCRRTSRSSRCTSGASPRHTSVGQMAPPRPLRQGFQHESRGRKMLSVDGINQYYGGSHILRDVALRGAGRRGHRDPGPQRRRQDHAAEEPDGPGAGEDRQHPVRRRRHHAARTPYERVRRGHRLRAAGPRDLRPADGRGKPAHGPGDASRAARRSRPSCSSCSRC